MQNAHIREHCIETLQTGEILPGSSSSHCQSFDNSQTGSQKKAKENERKKQIQETQSLFMLQNQAQPFAIVCDLHLLKNGYV